MNIPTHLSIYEVQIEEASIVDKIKENRFRRLNHVLKREQTKAAKLAKEIYVDKKIQTEVEM